MHLSNLTSTGTISGGTALQTSQTHMREDTRLDFIYADELFTDTQDSIGLPIILILGPPASGKGTLSKRLTADFNLHHLSTGDWLRAQTVAPIAGVSDRINRYVHADEVVPEDVLTAEYQSEQEIPPALLLYNCTKRNVSTPFEMWLRALPELNAECQRIARKQASSPPKAILLDNFPKTITLARAAAEVFGASLPALVISVTCPEEISCARFLGRARGNDDAAKFRRRFARSAAGTPAVVDFYRGVCPIVEVDAAGEIEDVYSNLIAALGACQT